MIHDDEALNYTEMSGVVKLHPGGEYVIMHDRWAPTQSVNVALSTFAGKRVEVIIRELPPLEIKRYGIAWLYIKNSMPVDTKTMGGAGAPIYESFEEAQAICETLNAKHGKYLRHYPYSTTVRLGDDN